MYIDIEKRLVTGKFFDGNLLYKTFFTTIYLL